MAKFRKKPVVIEAFQYIARDWAHRIPEGAVPVWLKEACNTNVIQFSNLVPWMTIHTKEGQMNCPDGHWIIKGVEGELYACDPQIFAKTYEAVNDNG
jgi:hypothetical protein